MPRYFIDTFNTVVVRDEDGAEFGDTGVLRREIHQTLARMMEDEKDGRSSIQLGADVRDENGKNVMRATLLMIIDTHE